MAKKYKHIGENERFVIELILNKVDTKHALCQMAGLLLPKIEVYRHNGSIPY